MALGIDIEKKIYKVIFVIACQNGNHWTLGKKGLVQCLEVRGRREKGKRKREGEREGGWGRERERERERFPTTNGKILFKISVLGTTLLLLTN